MNDGTYQIQHLVKHQVQDTYRVPAGRLFQELEALGVPARLRTHEPSTAACGYYGEYAKWELIEEETMKLPRVSKSSPLHAMASKKGTKVAEYNVPDQIANGTQDGPGARPAKAAVKLCGCTCGEPVSAKATFRQGHDQKLIGKLAAAAVDPQAYLTNELVQRLQLPTEAEDPKLDIQTRIDHVSDAMAKHYSDALTAKYVYAAGVAWDKAVRNKKTAPVTPKSIGQPNATPAASKTKNERTEAREERTEPVAGAEVRIKVGRHAYDATVHGMNQAGKITAVRYYTPGGHEMVKTEGQFTLVTP
jgi:hypothetical protein